MSFSRNPAVSFARRLLLVAAMLLSATIATGQFDNVNTADNNEEGMQRSRFARADRTLLRLLDQIEPLIDAGRNSDAVRCIGSILEHPNDYFVETNDGESTRKTLKSEARRYLRELPREARELYELRYGATAERMLREAAAKRDADAMAEVVVRYFHTKAGHQAAMLLGLSKIDDGHFAPAINVLTQLRDEGVHVEIFEPSLSLALAYAHWKSGNEDAATETLESLRRRGAYDEIQLGGDTVRLYAEGDDPLAWLETTFKSPTSGGLFNALAGDWRMHRASPSRNDSRSASVPLLNPAWRVRTIEYPVIEDYVRELRHQSRVLGVESVLPSQHPLIVGDAVLARTLNQVIAIDKITGKRIWESNVGEDPFEALTGPSNGASMQIQNPTIQRQQLLPALLVRLWGDTTFGTLSSDGRRVYSVDDLDLTSPNNRVRTVIRVLPNGLRKREQVGPKAYSILVARDVETGEILWSVGGPEDLPTEGDGQPVLRGPNEGPPLYRRTVDSPNEEEKDAGEEEEAKDDAPGLRLSPLAGTFFLGPPLPLHGRLYVIAERGGEVALLVLSPEDGRLLWELPLVDSDRTIAEEALRRVAGLTPSESGGILICPTSVYSIVAIDLATHAPLWGYTYDDAQQGAGGAWQIASNQRNLNADPTYRSVDVGPIIAEQRVLIAPAETPKILCLDLADGKLLWSAPSLYEQDHDRYIACVHDGIVAIVTETGMRALRLSDGKPAWKEADSPKWPGRTRPSGQGFRVNDEYFVPLSNASVVSVRLSDGKQVRAAKSRTNSIPGNLVADEDRILSQRGGAVEAFHQIESLLEDTTARLEADPDDAEALALRGQIEWNEGKFDEAVASVTRSIELNGPASTKDLLRSIYFDGLDNNFAEFVDREDKILPLIFSTDQRARLQRLMATGYERTGDYAAALQRYEKLMELPKENYEMVAVEDGWNIHLDHWLGSRMSSLHDKAEDETRTAVETLARKRLDAAKAAGTTDDLERFVQAFSALPIADEARDLLLKQYREQEAFLDLQLLLQSIGEGRTRLEQADALLRLADTFAAAEQWKYAAECYDHLERAYADIEWSDGTRVVDRLEKADENPRVAALRSIDRAWPRGRVGVAIKEARTDLPHMYNYARISFDRPRGPFFSDVNFQCQSGMTYPLVASDGLGRKLWEAPLRNIDQNQPIYFNPQTLSVAPLGQLLIVTTGTQIMAYDTRNPSPSDEPTLLWRHDAASGHAVRYANPFLMAAPMFAMRAYSVNQPGGIVALPNIVCFLDCGNLVAVHPITGEKLWEREGLGNVATIFGDEEYLFALDGGASQGGGFSVGHLGETTARVFRTSDGEEIGQRSVPLQQVATVGRKILTWERGALFGTFALIDPWIEDEDERVIWQVEKLDDDSYHQVVDQEFLAILDPKGRFRVLRLETGEPIIEQTFDLPARPGNASSNQRDLRFWRTEEGFMALLIRDKTVASTSSHRLYPIPGASPCPVGRGALMAFDRDGRPLWDEPTIIQNCHFPPEQPADAPAVLFGAMVRHMSENNRTDKTTQWVLAVDRRTGRVVADHEFEGSTHAFVVSADPVDDTMKVEYQQQTLVLTFTDEPVEPLEHTKYFSDPDGLKAAEEEKEQEDSERTLGQAIIQALGGALPKNGPIRGEIKVQQMPAPVQPQAPVPAPPAPNPLKPFDKATEKEKADAIRNRIDEMKARTEEARKAAEEQKRLREEQLKRNLEGRDSRVPIPPR